MAQSQDVLPLSPTSPAVPTVGNKEEEETALVNDKGKDAAPSEDVQSNDTQGMGLWNPLKWNWRDIMSFVTPWLTCMFVSTSFSMIMPFFPNEAMRKGASSVVIGVIISSASLCVVIFSPVFGYFQPKLGVRFTLLFGLLLVGGAYVLLGFTYLMPSGWVFIMMCILLRLMEGVGFSMFKTAAMTIPPQLYPESVGTVTGLMDVSAGIGFTIGPPLGGVLYAAGGFGLPFWVLGGITLLFIPLCFMIIDFKKSSHQQVIVLDLSTLWRLSTNFPFFTLLLGIILINAAYGSTFPTFQLFLNKKFGFNEEQVGLVLLVGPLIFLISALFVGALTDKIGPRYLIIVGFLIAGIAGFLLGPAAFISTPRVWVTIIAYGIVGVGGALARVPIYADLLIIAKSLTPDKDTATVTGLVSGLVVSYFSAGLFIGPLVGGALYSAVGFQTSAVVFGEFMFAKGFVLLGITIIDRLHRRQTRR